MSDYISEIFGVGGLFASRFPNYEVREGQVALARMVDQAMTSERHALGEGPCGTGKSVAYAVPAVRHAHHQRKRVVVATANIALQEQLVRKDLPMLAEVLPWPFTFALLKGRNNYLCVDKLEETKLRSRLPSFGALQDQFDEVLAWSATTARGDVSELPFIPDPQVWSRFSVSSDECKGSKCKLADRCHAMRAKAAAAVADIVVTNYHLLFAHLAVRRETGQDLVLPPFDLLVLDEAHEAADIARDFFGFTVSEYTLGRLASAAAELGGEALSERILQESKRLFDDISRFARSPTYRRRLRVPGFASADGLRPHLQALAELARWHAEQSAEHARKARARHDERAARLADDAEAQASRIASRAATARKRIDEGIAQADPEKVYWLDVNDKGRAKLGAKPIDVKHLLRAELFDRCPSVTAVSATLTTSGTFDFVRRELGVPDEALEVIADSPFDFESQALLVVPERMPDPREPDFVDAAADVFREVLRACDGRTLGLFTSYKNLNGVYERLAGTRHRLLRQGDLPRAELTRIFKEDVSSVLLGTESFWTGIDVSGEALTGLVIDKLPFPHPDDPVIDAICERDPRAFDNYLVPLAVIALRQGIGRLIRSKTDIGVAVILDPRIAEKRYGQKFLTSLPPMLATRRTENIARFLQEAAYARAS